MSTALASPLDCTEVIAPGQKKEQGTPESRRVVQLDFVRGLAILAVLQYHVLSIPVRNSWARGFEYAGKRMGWMGVDLFFVLSGFLVGGLLIQELIRSADIRIGRFLLRRLFKIWPAYYLYIAAQAVFGHYPLHTFLWQNALNIQNYTGTALGFTWSLAVEEHFYLVLPALLLLLYKSRHLRPKIPVILSSCCVVILCGRIVSVYFFHGEEPYMKTHARVDSLLFGVLLSYAFYVHRDKFNRMLKWRPILFLCSLLGLLFAFEQGQTRI